MDEATSLVWAMVAIIGILLATLFTVSLKLRAVQRDLKQLGKSLDSLENRLVQQEARLSDIRASMLQGQTSGLEQVIDALRSLRTKGLIPALSMLGMHLFRTYLSKRRQRALPIGKVQEP